MKYVKKVICVVMSCMLFVMSNASALEVADSFSVSRTISGSTYTASGSSVDNPNTGVRKVTTSCSYGAGATSNGTFRYYDYDANTLVTKTGGASGQYGAVYSFAEPSCDYLDIYVEGTHSYIMGSNTYSESTKDLATNH